MIIFINGTFGSGKTTVAELLVKALPNSMLYDPEEIGVAVRTILQPIDQQDDFQHYPLWRKLTVYAAGELREKYGRDLVIPMTIWREQYFREVTDGLRALGSNFHHFCLTASVATVHERLNTRGQQQPGSWSHQQALEAVPALESPLFAQHIRTEDKTPTEIVKIILATL